MGRPKIQIDKDLLERLYIREQKSPKEIGALIGCNRQTIINRLREYGLRVRTKGEGTALAKITYPRTDFSGDAIEKAYLLGFRFGDLTVDKINPGGSTIRVSCASTRPEQIELIGALFEKYGRVLLNGPYKGGRIFVQCLLNMSFEFLLHKSDEIPNWIQEDNDSFWAFLGGYSDAEAHIGISGGKASYRLATADANILSTIHAKLMQHQIAAPKPYAWLKKGYTNKAGATVKKEIWRLGIYSTESLSNFLERLLPYLQHRKRKENAQTVFQFLKTK